MKLKNKKYEAMEWSGMIEELRDSTGSYRYNLDKLIGHGTYGNVYIGVNSITGLLAISLI